MNHLEVVSILKELPQDVRMVCGRGDVEMIPFTEENVRKNLGIGFGGSQNMEILIPASDRLVKAKSDGSLATTSGGGPSADDSFSKLKSRYGINTGQIFLFQFQKILLCINFCATYAICISEVLNFRP